MSVGYIQQYSHAEEKRDVDYIPLACTLCIRYAAAMESHTICLREPLIIPKELDENLLFMVDSSMLQLWPQLVRLCEMEKLSLYEVTERVAILDPLKFGVPKWYSYKMRALLRAHFVHDEVQPCNVIIHAAEGRG